MNTSIVPEKFDGLHLKSLDDLTKLGDILAKSGYFSDARSAAQAIVKICAGIEYGFGPIASMTGIHIIEGKPSVGAHLMASMIKKSGRYDYKLMECTPEKCSILFLEKHGDRWENLGPAIVMTMEDAKKSGLAIGKDGKMKSNWQRSPDDMLFARCISKGYRRYTPDLSGGLTVYAHEEIEDAPANTPDIIDTTCTVNEPASEPPQNGNTQQNSDLITKEQYEKELHPLFLARPGYMAKLKPILGIERFGDMPCSWLPLVKEVILKIKEPLEFQSLYLANKTLATTGMLRRELALKQLQSMEGANP